MNPWPWRSNATVASGDRRYFGWVTPDATVQVVGGYVELGQFEERVCVAIIPERIQVGDEVAELAVGVDEVVDAHRGGILRGTGRGTCE